MEDEPARHEQIERPARIARRGDRDQRHDQGGDQAACLDQADVDALEQHRLGVHEEVVGEQRSNAEAQIFDRPSPVRRGVGKQVLDHQKPDQREHQAGEHADVDGRDIEGDDEPVPAAHVDQGDRDTKYRDDGRNDRLQPPGGAALPCRNQHREQEGDPAGGSRDLEQRHDHVRLGHGIKRLVGRRRRPGRGQRASPDQPRTQWAAPPARQHQHRDEGVGRRRRGIAQECHGVR